MLWKGADGVQFFSSGLSDTMLHICKQMININLIYHHIVPSEVYMSSVASVESPRGPTSSNIIAKLFIIVMQLLSLSIRNQPDHSTTTIEPIWHNIQRLNLFLREDIVHIVKLTDCIQYRSLQYKRKSLQSRQEERRKQNMQSSSLWNHNLILQKVHVYQNAMILHIKVREYRQILQLVIARWKQTCSSYSARGIINVKWITSNRDGHIKCP